MATWFQNSLDNYQIQVYKLKVMASKHPITKLIVPLAGLGTRFAPSSTAYPKELTHLVDKPILQYLVEEAVESGIKEIIFILNQSKDSIQKYFSPKYQDAYLEKAFSKPDDAPEDLIKLHELIKKIKFRYIKKQSTLGDGHSILFARPFIKSNEAFVVSMGDLLGFDDHPFIQQLMEVYEEKNVPVVSVEKVPLEATSRFGVIKPKKSKGRLHQVVDIIEKPGPALAPSRLILTGKYILTPEFFSILENLVKNHTNGEVKLADALKVYSHTHEMYAYECKGKIQDTGNKLDFIRATINFGITHPKFAKPLKKFIKSLKL
ncbi:MAG: UTP-glucose-1-phosphate uridylyltransferase [Parcubacteria group bacterium GW2011_GWA2_40_14]|nr:MAG: UTP-glucose-1-phosphate uridylyltransferase [Parcubacteria group bacterium GW2011_GWA2_40_14]